jgi:PKD repeat protein
MLNGYREIPLNIDVKTNGNFEFNFESVETMPVSVVVYLKDNKTNTMVNLRDQNNYTFTTEIGDAENRFLIIFYPSLSVFTENSNCDINGSIKIEGNGLPWTYNVEDNNGYFIATGIIGNQEEVEVPVMAGTYKLNIQLNNSLYSDVFENIIVEGSIKPTAEINIPEKEVNLGEVVHFYNTSTHSETLEWNFGDGNFSTETNPSHTYYTSGWYEVILRVYSQDQCEAVTSENVWVKSETLNISETTTNPTQISLYSYNQTLYVNIPSEIDIHASSLRLNVMNLDGRLNKIYPLVGVEGVQEIFTDLACGLYLIQITDNKQLYLQTKVILAN